MNLLFIHQNFPGQFKFLTPALVKQGRNVTVMTMQRIKAKDPHVVRLFYYALKSGSTPNVHPWVADFETIAIRAEVFFVQHYC